MTDAAAPSRTRTLGLAAAALAAAALAAFAGAATHRISGGAPERGVMLIVVLDGALIAAMLVALATRRHKVSAGSIGAATFGAVALLAVAAHFISIASLVRLPADILLWSESDFVNDILKLRVGHQLYGPPGDLNSFNYPPLTQLLSYGIATLFGHPTSIPFYRAIQVGYVAVAAVLGTLAAGRLLQIARPDATIAPRWPLVWAPVVFLFATNATTNPYVHYLHDDALSLLVSSGAFLLLVEYAASRKVGLLLALALVPAVGFLVKQSLLIWAPLVGLHLLLFDRPRSWPRIVGYGVGAAAVALLTYGACRVILGPYFHYWVITVLGSHPISPLRGVQHVLDAWAFFAALLLAGLALLKGDALGRLAGPWLVAFLLLGIEAWTSGVAWMLNHLGPGSLLAGVWACAAIPAIWPRTPIASATPPRDWLPVGAAAALGCLMIAAIGAVRVPDPQLPPDVPRYVADIEREFRDLPPDRVLLDHGTWMYLRSGTVMRDRSATAGEAGYTGTAVFGDMLHRIQTHYYARILVRDLRGPQLMYDYWMWRNPSGIREALLASYQEVRRIPAVRGQEHGSPWYREISVLEPRN